MVRLLACGLMVAALAACAPRNVPWQHAGLPKEQWADDYSACRRAAENDVGWREEEGSSPFREYDRQQAKRQVDRSTTACMRERGYVPKKGN